MKFSIQSAFAKASTAIGLSLAAASNAFATTPTTTTGDPFDLPDIDGIRDEGAGTQGIIAAIVDIIDIVLNLLGIIAVVVVIIAGIRLIIGGQDEGQREKARNMIVYAIVGLLIVIFAKVIIGFVVNAFMAP